MTTGIETNAQMRFSGAFKLPHNKTIEPSCQYGE